MYFFSLIFMSGVLDYLKANEVSPMKDEMLNMYGGLLETMFTLFQAITGGNDWFDMQHLLSQVSTLHGVLFIIYIFWMIFGIFNIIVGVFVDRAFEASCLDVDLVIKREEAKMDGFIKEVLSIYDEVDAAGGKGTIDRDAFTLAMNDQRIKTYMQMNHLDLIEPAKLFQLLDTNNSGEISECELILGMMHLCGEAKSVDLVTLVNEMRIFHSKMSNFFEDIAQWPERAL